MVVALRRKTTVYAQRQDTFGSFQTTAAANAILINNDSVFVKTKREILERPVLRKCLSKFRHVVGRQFTEGNLIAEVKGSGTQGTAPELDPFFDVLLGLKSIQQTATIVRHDTHGDVGGENSATLIHIATLFNRFTVGNMVRVGTGSTFGVAFIHATRATSLLLTPALGFVPTFGHSISKSVTYRPNFTSGYLTVDQYLDNVRLHTRDVKVATLTMNVVANQLVVADFSLKGTISNASAESDALDPSGSFDTNLPPVAMNCRLNVGGANMDVMNMELTIELELKERLSLRSSDSTRIVAVARTVTGSLDPHMENKDLVDDFVNGTASALILEVGTTAGNIMAIYMPRIQYTDMDMVDESGEYKYALPFQAVSPVATPEREIVISFV